MYVFRAKSGGIVGLLTSLTQSDAFVELGEEVTAVSPGDRVAVLPFGAVF